MPFPSLQNMFRESHVKTRENEIFLRELYIQSGKYNTVWSIYGNRFRFNRAVQVLNSHRNSDQQSLLHLNNIASI